MIQCDFDSHSFDLKIREFKGKNLRFRIDPLFDSLAVEKCSLTIKSDSITLTLKKENAKNWSSLKWQKEKEIKKGTEKKGADLDDKDPQASLMNLMKDLYQNGSDDIKKTIAESWTKSKLG